MDKKGGQNGSNTLQDDISLQWYIHVTNGEAPGIHGMLSKGISSINQSISTCWTG